MACTLNMRFLSLPATSIGPTLDRTYAAPIAADGSSSEHAHAMQERVWRVIRLVGYIQPISFTLSFTLSITLSITLSFTLSGTNKPMPPIYEPAISAARVEAGPGSVVDPSAPALSPPVPPWASDEMSLRTCKPK